MINKLGFGFLRLPKKDGELDWQTICSMVDVFMGGGGVFFDTCYTYLDGLSEAAIHKCVVERKPRHSFQLCDKLPGISSKATRIARSILTRNCPVAVWNGSIF